MSAASETDDQCLKAEQKELQRLRTRHPGTFVFTQLGDNHVRWHASKGVRDQHAIIVAVLLAPVFIAIPLAIEAVRNHVNWLAYVCLSTTFIALCFAWLISSRKIVSAKSAYYYQILESEPQQLVKLPRLVDELLLEIETCAPKTQLCQQARSSADRLAQKIKLHNIGPNKIWDEDSYQQFLAVAAKARVSFTSVHLKNSSSAF